MAAFAPENTITFSSFSKAFAMTGWRIGYMIAPESINLTAKLINEAIAYSAPTPSQRAGIYALNHYDTLVPQVVAVFKERLTYIEQRLLRSRSFPYPQSKEACMPSSTLNKRGWTLSGLSRNY